MALKWLVAILVGLCTACLFASIVAAVIANLQKLPPEMSAADTAEGLEFTPLAAGIGFVLGGFAVREIWRRRAQRRN